ncbi:hypothetical protein K9M09_02970, partial [Patescibacteria group bacterium]|nr:hypothetical protein [Patescibacteria group bacterium]
MLENFEKQVIEKIKHTGMTPKPRWHFLLKEVLIWLFGALSLFVGAAAVAVMIYLFGNSDLMMHARLGHSFIGYLLLSLPYFWMIFLALFLWLLFYNIKHSKRGYHYSVYLIALMAVLASIFLGVIFSAVGVGEKIDDILGRQAPLYDRVFNPHVAMWSQAEEGRLTGLVISKPDQTHFVLLDRSSGEWYVAYIDKNNENLVVVGQPVRVLGELIGEHEFRANEIFPMKPGREFFKRLRPNKLPPSLIPADMPEQGFSPGKMMPNDQIGIEDLQAAFNKYPELKTTFEQNLVNNKGLTAVIVEQNPNFITELENLGISADILEQI